MNLIRILLIIIALVIIYRMIRRYLARPSPKVDKASAKPTDIVPCAICGVHVPRDTAILKNNRYYCSQEHADQQ
jgi:uncharacterized protein